MSDYTVTYRIADRTIDGLTYQQRWSKLVDNLRKDGMGRWEGTTSFALIESSLTMMAFGRRTVHGLSPKHDFVVIIDQSDGSACYFGAIPYEDVLLSFKPTARRLS